MFCSVCLFVCFCFNCDRDTHVAANDGNLHHLCFTWRNSDGLHQLYQDGLLFYNNTGLQTGYTIKGKGIPIIGQEQDLPSGSNCGDVDTFDSSQSFQGLLTNLNLWSCVLPVTTVFEMFQYCLHGEGDVLKWSDFKHNIKGSTEVIVPSLCY